VCRWSGRSHHHIISGCPAAIGQQANQERIQAQREIQYPHGKAACFKCGVPTQICERWSADGTVQDAA
jgi:hypothetical protein